MLKILPLLLSLVFATLALLSGLAFADPLPPPLDGPVADSLLGPLEAANGILICLADQPAANLMRVISAAAEKGIPVHAVTNRRHARAIWVRQLRNVKLRIIDKDLSYSFAVVSHATSTPTVLMGSGLTQNLGKVFFVTQNEQVTQSLTDEFVFLWNHSVGPSAPHLDNKSVPISRPSDFVLTSTQIAPMQIGSRWRFHSTVKPRHGVLFYQLRGVTASAKTSLTVETIRLDRRDVYLNLLTTQRRGVRVTVKTPTKPDRSCKDVRFPDCPRQLLACLKQAGIDVQVGKVARETTLIADQSLGFYSSAGLTNHGEIGSLSLGAIFQK